MDQLRDGVITDGDLKSLADTIRSRSEIKAWILDELDLSGLISQALDSSGPRDFLRSFLVRKASETVRNDFAKATEQRLVKEGRTKRSNKRRASLNPFSLLFGRRSGVAYEGAARRRFSRLAIRVLPAALAVIVIVMGIRLLSGIRLPVRILSADPDVVVVRGQRKMQVTSDLRLRNGDRIVVPRNGSAVLHYRNQTIVQAGSQTDLTLEPDAILLFGDETSALGNLYLKRGGVTVQGFGHNRGENVALFTPHLLAQSAAAKFVVSVTPTSTRLEVEKGSVRVTRKDDGQALTINKSEKIMVTGKE